MFRITLGGAVGWFGKHLKWGKYPTAIPVIRADLFLAILMG